jgi:hypothetical protein
MKNRHLKSKLMFGAILLAGMAVHAQDTAPRPPVASAPTTPPPAAPSNPSAADAPRDKTTPKEIAPAIAPPKSSTP